jgi:type IV secretion system protein VirB10
MSVAPKESTVASQDRVLGERAETAAHRARSIQSRVSNVLAMGLMSALGIGALTWYYAHALTRQDKVRRNAEIASARRGDGDLPLPPLGRIDAPQTVVPADNAQPELAPQFLTELPASRESPAAPLVPADAYAIPGAGFGGAAAPAAKTPAQLDLERQLAGTAFVAVSTGGGSGGASQSTESGELARPDAPVPDARRLAELLRPIPTSAVRAQILPTMRLLLPKGAFIDCTLETAIDSSLPGMTTCVTATDTFGVDGQVVLLERGTKLVGEVRGQVQQGAARMFVLWTEARTPTGVIIPLASPGADELGRAGLPGTVERHFWQRFGAAMLVTVIDGAVQAAAQSGNRGDGTVIYNPSAGGDVMTEVLKNTINIPPTITKTQGDRIQVLVARDLDFRGVYALRPIPAAR